MVKLGILATHPIQYHAPLFRELAERKDVDLRVYFCHQPTPQEQGTDFGVAFEWDVDLTSGYKNYFLKNVAQRPAQGFFGYDTPDIKNIIQLENFDFFIVHGWAWKSCWQAFQACWKAGTPLGVRSDSQLPQSNVNSLQKLKGLIKRFVYPMFIGKFDLCLPYGQRSAVYFEKFGGRNIVIAPHYIDNEWFASRAEGFRCQRIDQRRQWQIPEDAFCFLFCGKLQNKKRPLDLLKAFEQLHLWSKGHVPRITPIHLLVAGDGELRIQCEEYVKRHELPVSFAGFLNQGGMPKAYAVADCLVLPSDSGETWGLVVNEAMACGLPVIVSDACGCIPDLIVEGITGYSFACGDVSDLRDKMKMVFELSKNGLAINEDVLRHISMFSVSRAADVILVALRTEEK